MKIAVIGKGNVGGGLADRWERAGHDVTRIGKDGGDVSDADAVFVAVPGGAIADALDNVRGIEGKTVVDATNLLGADRPEGFTSNAEYVKSRTHGPTAKAFNLNFARAYDQIDSTRVRPSNIWTGDEEARDAGYEPVYAGGLENARAQEDALGLIFAINQNGLGPFVYRMARPEEL
jgi:predicted dinucleotide-binding enzyme